MLGVTHPRSLQELDVEEMKKVLKQKEESLYEKLRMEVNQRKQELQALKKKNREEEHRKEEELASLMLKTGVSNPYAGKKMKEIVPYTGNQSLFISKYIGFDITDEIPDEHEEDSEFVINQTLSYGKDTKACYKGWMKNGMMHGRGTLLCDYTEHEYRYDGMWKYGKKHGKGREMPSYTITAYQGVFENGSENVEGMTYYDNYGTVNKFTNGGWKTIQAAKHN